MTKKMGGGRLKGLSKEDRRIEFCSIAKECSKGIPYEEAKGLCKEAASTPKPLKVKGSRKRSPQSCEREVHELASCMVDKIDMNLADNINSVETAIINSMMECKCPNPR